MTIADPGSAPRRGRRARLAAFVVLGLAAFLAGVPAVSAHAVLLSMSPEPDTSLSAPPTEIELVFNEPVSITHDAIRVFDPSGRELDGIEVSGEDAVVTAALPSIDTEGSYTVAWKALSPDGHAVRGAYLFHLGRATLTDPIDVGEGAASWPSVLRGIGTVLALGSLALLLGGVAVQRTPSRRRCVVAFVVASGGALLALVGSILVVGASLSESISVALRTSSARATAAAFVVLVVGSIAAALGLGRRGSVGLAVLAVALLGLQGHAVSLPPLWLSASMTVLHVLAAVGWIAGLVWLERRTREESTLVLRSDVMRFSPWALGSVVVLATTGVVLVVDRVPLGELLSAWYGRVALVKVALLVIAVLFAYRNRSVLAPALGETNDDGEIVPASHDDHVVGLLRRSVRREMLVLAAALVAGAVLAQIAPPEEGVRSGGYYEDRIAFAGGTVDLTLDPGTRGMNELHVIAYTDDGRLNSAVTDMVTGFTLESEDVGPLIPEMQQVTAGHSVAYVRIPLGGDWTVEVTGKLGKFEEATATFEVPIGR